MPINELGGGSSHQDSIFTTLTSPALIGFLCGGIPFAISFSRLGGRVVSPELLRMILYLSPIAIVIAMAEGIPGIKAGWKTIALRSLFTSFFACVPLPVIVCIVLQRRWGYDFLSPSNFLVLIAIFVVWASVVSILGWALVVTYAALKNRKAGGPP